MVQIPEFVYWSMVTVLIFSVPTTFVFFLEMWFDRNIYDITKIIKQDSKLVITKLRNKDTYTIRIDDRYLCYSMFESSPIFSKSFNILYLEDLNSQVNWLVDSCYYQTGIKLPVEYRDVRDDLS